MFNFCFWISNSLLNNFSNGKLVNKYIKCLLTAFVGSCYFLSVIRVTHLVKLSVTGKDMQDDVPSIMLSDIRSTNLTGNHKGNFCLS